MAIPTKREMYIEQKTDGNRTLDDKGRAVIGEVTFSRTGKTLYHGGKTFHRMKKGGIYGNYYCEEDGNEYWITGVKKNGGNRVAARVVERQKESCRKKVNRQM